MAELARCDWVAHHPELEDYHDNVWGRPTRDDREIFAAYGQCILHAGLVWTAMLKKRPVFAAAFDGWDIARVAEYDGAEIDRLVNTPGMMRNFVKINCIIWNAARILEAQAEHGSFGEYLWQFTDGDVLDGNTQEARARRVAEELSHDLKRRKFKFAGPATAYGLMEDIGMVNDHSPGCFRALDGTNG
jgi:DNA-3-methyladenine glycosylase I